MLCVASFCLIPHSALIFCFFFFNDTATTEIYTLSLHDALPISGLRVRAGTPDQRAGPAARAGDPAGAGRRLQRQHRSEEHTSELQSPCNLVCRLLLEKKKKTRERRDTHTKTTTARTVRREASSD